MPACDISSQSADDRLRELASIMAAGILRLNGQHARVGVEEGNVSRQTHKIKPDFQPTCLELPANTVLSVLHGVVNGQRDPETRST